MAKVLLSICVAVSLCFVASSARRFEFEQSEKRSRNDVAEGTDLQNSVQEASSCSCKNGFCVKAVCTCPTEYGLYTKNQCKECKCGKESNCTFGFTWNLFGDKPKTCVCKRNYKDQKGTCIGPCNPNPCGNRGTCNDTKDGFKCKCPPPYTGNKCETKTDFCATSPCKNGATCLGTVNGYKCKCTLGFIGADCEVKDPCLQSNQCLNGGTCKLNGTDFVCLCRPPYSGIRCGKSPCTDGPCMNGGTCGISKVNNNFTCKCAEPFRGDRCEIDPCSTKPCQNGGTCKLKGKSFECGCALPFYGAKCEKECKCANGRCEKNPNGKVVCVCPPEFGLYSANTCQICNCGPRSNCTFDVGFFTDEKKCLCPDGSKETGGICVEDPCSDNPCGNGGTCSVDAAAAGSFKCNCRAPYFGKKCEQKCSCVNGTCETDEGNGLRCVCPPEFGLSKVDCKECNCGENANCTFETLMMVEEKKSCICPLGFREKRGRCQEALTSTTSASTTPKSVSTTETMPSSSASRPQTSTKPTENKTVTFPYTSVTTETTVSNFTNVATDISFEPTISTSETNGTTYEPPTKSNNNGTTYDSSRSTSDNNGTTYEPLTKFTSVNNETTYDPPTKSTSENNGTTYEPPTKSTSENNGTTYDSTRSTADNNGTTYDPTRYTSDNNGTTYEPPTNSTSENNVTTYEPTISTADNNGTTYDPTRYTSDSNGTTYEPPTNSTADNNGTTYEPTTSSSEPDVCRPGHCENGGTCVPTAGGPECRCSYPHAGVTCNDSHWCTEGEGRGLCPDGTCRFNFRTRIGRCECPDHHFFNYAQLSCEAVDLCPFMSEKCTGDHEICVRGECQCEPHFKRNSEKICVPAFCDSNPCGEGETCHDSGDVRCTCKQDHAFDGTSCRLIDVCSVPSILNCQQVCNPAERVCECYPGFWFTLQADNKTCKISDEKKLCSKACGLGGVCVKHGQDDICLCPGTHPLNGSTCIDKCTAGRVPKGLCPGDQCLPDPKLGFRCKCEGKLTYDATGVTCRKRGMCNEGGGTESCRAKGAICIDDFETEKGHRCECPNDKERDTDGVCKKKCLLSSRVEESRRLMATCETDEDGKVFFKCPPITTQGSDEICTELAKVSYTGYLPVAVRNNSLLKAPQQNDDLLEGVERDLTASMHVLFGNNFKAANILHCRASDVSWNCSVEIQLLSNPQEQINLPSESCISVDETVCILPPRLLLRKTELRPDAFSRTDPCQEDLKMHNCGSSETDCRKLGGDDMGFECTCALGFESYGSYRPFPFEEKTMVHKCRDIDECAVKTQNACPNRTRCFNTYGSFECLCLDGFHRSPGSTQCTEICDPKMCLHGTCEVTGGAFHCRCAPGYKGLGCDQKEEAQPSTAGGASGMRSALIVLSTLVVPLILVSIFLGYKYRTLQKETLKTNYFDDTSPIISMEPLREISHSNSDEELPES